jgi:hypothetical protein
MQRRDGMQPGNYVPAVLSPGASLSKPAFGIDERSARNDTFWIYQVMTCVSTRAVVIRFFCGDSECVIYTDEFVTGVVYTGFACGSGYCNTPSVSITTRQTRLDGAFAVALANDRLVRWRARHIALFRVPCAACARGCKARCFTRYRSINTLW